MSKQSTAMVVDSKTQYRAQESFLLSKENALARVAPKHLTAERMIRLYLGSISKSPRLLECTPESILLSLMDAAYYGLEPNPVLGHAFLVPYRNSKTGVTEAQFQVGYKGLILLAHRSGAVRDIEATMVHERDLFKIVRHADPQFVHEPAFIDDPGKPIGVYAVAHMASGHRKFLPLTIAEVNKYRARSPRADAADSPWVTDFAAMAKKTSIRRIASQLPLEATSHLAQVVAQESEWERSGESSLTPPARQQRELLGYGEETKSRGDDLTQRIKNKGKSKEQTDPKPEPPKSGPPPHGDDDLPVGFGG